MLPGVGPRREEVAQQRESHAKNVGPPTALAVGVLVLAGCGSDDDGGGAAAGESSSPDGTKITATTAPAAPPAY